MGGEHSPPIIFFEIIYSYCRDTYRCISQTSNFPL
nr:MAG TPA: xyloglucan endo-transglycosylase [Caudoviricetes sp.]